MAENTTTSASSSGSGSTQPKAPGQTAGLSPANRDIDRDTDRHDIGNEPSDYENEAPEVKQYVKASVDDAALEPDAMRGTEHVMRDAGTEDKEEARRDVYRTPEEKDRVKKQRESEQRTRDERKRRESGR